MGGMCDDRREPVYYSTVMVSEDRRGMGVVGVGRSVLMTAMRLKGMSFCDGWSRMSCDQWVVSRDKRGDER